MTPEEKMARLKRTLAQSRYFSAQCDAAAESPAVSLPKIAQTLNEVMTRLGVDAESVDERPTYESIAAKLTRVEAGLAVLIEKLAPPENANEGSAR